MKNIYKNLALGMFLTVSAAAFSAPVLAQDVCADVDANTALYNKYIENYEATKPLAQRKIAVEAGKEYIQKYEACMTVAKDAAGAETKTPTYAAQITYFKENVPVLEKAVIEEDKIVRDKPMYDKFKAGLKAKSTADILSSGKEILSRYPDDKDSLDVAITMASASFDELIAKPTATTYNADLITYAKLAIEKIEAGKTSPTFGYATYKLGTKTKALGVLNYAVGLAMVNDPAMKKEAAGYFYKSSQNDSVFKNVPLLYQAIGSTYLDEFLKIDTERKAKIIDNKNTPETLELEAMQRGYAERAIEAYARAYKNAKDTKAKKEYVDTLSTRLKELYAFRYDGKPLENLDTYVSTVTGKTLTDPKATVTPVKIEEPATTPPTSGTTTTPATTTPATTKPATTTTPAKPASPATTTKPATTTEADTTATAKPKAKKPAPKKKGTR